MVPTFTGYLLNTVIHCAVDFEATSLTSLYIPLSFCEVVATEEICKNRKIHW